MILCLFFGNRFKFVEIRDLIVFNLFELEAAWSHFFRGKVLF